MVQYHDLGTQSLCSFDQLPKALTASVSSLGLAPGTVRLPHNLTEVQLTLGLSPIQSSADLDMFWTERFILQNLPALQSGSRKAERALLLLVCPKFPIPTACSQYLLLGSVALFDLPFWAPDLLLPEEAGVSNNYAPELRNCWTSERFFQELSAPTGTGYLFVPQGRGVPLSVLPIVQLQNLYRHRFYKHPFYTSMLRDIRLGMESRNLRKSAAKDYLAEFYDMLKSILVSNAAEFNTRIRWVEFSDDLRAPLYQDGTCNPDAILARNIVCASLPHRYLLYRYRKYFTNVEFFMDCNGYISYVLELTPDWYLFGINR